MATPADTVRGFYAALGRGDVPGVLATLHDQLEWTESESFPYYSGTWRTPQEVVDKLLASLARDWDGFSATAHDFIGEGSRVVSLDHGKDSCAILTHLTPTTHNRQFTASTALRMLGGQHSRRPMTWRNGEGAPC